MVSIIYRLISQQSAAHAHVAGRRESGMSAAGDHLPDWNPKVDERKGRIGGWSGQIYNLQHSTTFDE